MFLNASIETLRLTRFLMRLPVGKTATYRALERAAKVSDVQTIATPGYKNLYAARERAEVRGAFFTVIPNVGLRRVSPSRVTAFVESQRHVRIKGQVSRATRALRHAASKGKRRDTELTTQNLVRDELRTAQQQRLAKIVGRVGRDLTPREAREAILKEFGLV